jgi:hypothetical protein
MAEIQRLESLGRGPKVRYMTGGPGILSGLTLDPMSMNAYEREAYLPKGSSDVMPTAGPGGESATMKEYGMQQAENAERRPDLHGGSYKEQADRKQQEREQAARKQQPQGRG